MNKNALNNRTAATPGPWESEDADRGAWIRGSNGEWAALACGNTDENARANAQLIAASPTVISDSQFLLDRLAELEIPEQLARDWYGHVEPAIERLRASIIQAIGI